MHLAQPGRAAATLLLCSVIWAQAIAEESHVHANVPLNILLNKINDERELDPPYKLVDIEVRLAGQEPRFYGVWRPVEGVVHVLLHASTDLYDDFRDQIEIDDYASPFV